MYAVGAGEFASAGQARLQVHYQYRYFYPQTNLNCQRELKC